MTTDANPTAGGDFTLVLHGHLPYVLSHGTWPHGSDMLFECAAESYLPLLRVFDRLVGEGISPKVTMGLTPVLCEQLAHPAFPEQFAHYLDLRITSAVENREEFARGGKPEFAELAEMWRGYFLGVKQTFQETYGGDLIAQYRRLQEGGHLEIITSAATHGYLPLLGWDECVQAQVKQAVAAHTRHFGRAPRGFWLPECAYRPRYEWASPLPEAGPQEPRLRKGVEEFLAENGLEYFIIDTATLLGGATSGVYASRFGGLQRLWEQLRANYQPGEAEVTKTPYLAYLVASVESDRPPVAAYTRDVRTGAQVWSGDEGYPGDGYYLDFHKKHFPGGHRFWRVTSSQTDLGAKELYQPARAADRVPENAAHFARLVHDIVAEQVPLVGDGAVLCAPYDAELFGHWWFEGPEWLYQVIRNLAADPSVHLVTGSEHLEQHVPEAAIALPEGSWGQGGFHWVWLNEWTDWIWRDIYAAEVGFPELARQAEASQDPLLRDIVTQAARELLLLEASDWPFLISTWSARDYAERRAAEHHRAFMRLAELARRQATGQSLSPDDLEVLEKSRQKDALFSDVNLQWWTAVEHPA